jgi:hypothetical protein
MKILSHDLIFTKYIGATNFKPSRIAVVKGSERSYYQWDYDFDTDDNHRSAARHFAGEWMKEHHEYDPKLVEVERLLVPESTGYAYAFLIVEA